ncbi:MAG TPA: AraC family transcriptional regulator [Microscillaceae bacterium]|nr:AraC family transcriptional regulator [Microscillaceae bacterium]
MIHDQEKIIRKILFVVPPQVHLLDINGPAHIFYEAREYGAQVELHFITPVNEDKVVSSSGLKFYDLVSFDHFELTKEDFIIVPGIYFSLLSDKKFLKNCQPFFQWLRVQHQLKVNISSVCTGTFLLAESGVLANKSCTTHWRRINAFKKRFPLIDMKEDRLFVVDENIYTSAGISSGIDLALYILEKKFGTKLAIDVAKEAVVYFRRSESDPQLSIFLQYRNHLNDRIHQAQEFIIENLGQKFTHLDIANHVNMSPRNLTRVFKKTTGVTIHLYTEKLRIEKALNLLAEKNKIETVASLCGFKSVSQLRKVLNNHQA